MQFSGENIIHASISSGKKIINKSTDMQFSSEKIIHEVFLLIELCTKEKMTLLPPCIL